VGAVGGCQAISGRVKIKGLVVRGGAFHNKIVEEVRAVFLSYGWEVETEFCCQRNEITTFFDVYAVRGDARIACEVETSVRHVADNVKKAESVGVRLWVVVPSRRLCRLVEQKLDGAGSSGFRGEAVVLLVGEVERKLGAVEGDRV